MELWGGVQGCDILLPKPCGNSTRLPSVQSFLACCTKYNSFQQLWLGASYIPVDSIKVIQAEVVQMLNAATNLEQLHIALKAEQIKYFACLRTLPNLRAARVCTLDLHEIDDLSDHTALEELGLTVLRTSMHGFQNVAQAWAPQGLRKFDICCRGSAPWPFLGLTDGTGKVVSHFRGLKELTLVSIQSHHLHAGCLDSLCDMSSSLTSLQFLRPDKYAVAALDQLLAKQITSLTVLQILVISNVDTTLCPSLQTFENIAGMTQLSKLVLQNWSWDMERLPPQLTALASTLRHLDIFGNIHLVATVDLYKLTSLTRLDATDCCSLSYTTIDGVLPAFRQLKHLTADSTHITAEQVAGFADQLTYLCVDTVFMSQTPDRPLDFPAFVELEVTTFFQNWIPSSVFFKSCNNCARLQTLKRLRVDFQDHVEMDGLDPVAALKPLRDARPDIVVELTGPHVENA